MTHHLQGMPGWRKFTFLDHDSSFSAAAPDVLAALQLERATCGASHATWAGFGNADGTVALVDTGSQATATFRGHPQGVLLTAALPVRTSDFSALPTPAGLKNCLNAFLDYFLSYSLSVLE